jgi:aminoglycoside 2'-N-acetyltransferase I
VAVLVRAHTAELSAETRDEIRRLLDEAFESEFTDEDWEHTLGGVHVLAREGDELVGHVAVVQRRLVHGELGIRTGYVEGLAVRASRRRRGHASALMREGERVITAAYDLGALSDGTGIDGFYERCGWVRWRCRPAWSRSRGLAGGRTRTRTCASSARRRARRSTSPARSHADWRPGDVW